MRFRPSLVGVAGAGGATGAGAHPGHVAEWAGHDHWVAGAAIGIGILIAAWGGLRGRRREPDAAEAEGEGARESEA